MLNMCHICLHYVIYIYIFNMEYMFTMYNFIHYVIMKVNIYYVG